MIVNTERYRERAQEVSAHELRRDVQSLCDAMDISDARIAELEASQERLAAVIRLIMERTAMGNPDDPDAGSPEWEARFHEGWMANWPGYREIALREAAAWRTLTDDDLGRR